tara:strand:- start:1293 stop:2957 length:1665 start_codon:yes stop_codon:yes gene_type:complete
MKKLSIGLLVDKPNANIYVEDLITWSKEQENISIDYLILQKKNKINKNQIQKIINIIQEFGISNLIQRTLFKILNLLEKKIILKKYPNYKNHYSEYNIEQKIKSKIEIYPDVSKKGNLLSYSEKDIKKIKSLNLDVILRFNSGILKGQILNCSKFGVLSFHHGDNRNYRGLPPGFWEVYNKSSSTGFIIQQLTDNLDGGNVIFRGNIITKAFYALNQSNLYQYSYFYLKKVLTELSIKNKLPNFEEKKPYYNTLYKEPSISQIILYFIFLLKKKISTFFLFKLLKKKYIWNVAFYPNSWKNLAMWKAKKINNPPGTYLADPFLIEVENKNYAFVEEYNFKKRKGIISVYLINSFSYERVGIALEENFHLSFPYIFQYEGKQYLLPETSKNKDIRIYECINFPLKWELKKILMKEVNALDNMIFKYDNLWWLFSNLCKFDDDKSSSELSIYYSENGPLTDEWIPHKKNPVITNADLSRNAGLIFDEKNIFRVSQSPNFMDYGNKFQINKIINLDLENYNEEPFHKVSPLFKKNLTGTHHISSNKKFTIFDYSELK